VLGGFGTFAVYLTELFRPRNRSTGQGFCWSTARILTAAGSVATWAIVNAARADSTWTEIDNLQVVLIFESRRHEGHEVHLR
jgi:hypothetical protein